MNENNEFEDAAVAIGSLAGKAMAIVDHLKELNRDVRLRGLMTQQIRQNHPEAIELIRSAEEHILILGRFIQDQARTATAPQRSSVVGGVKGLPVWLPPDGEIALAPFS
jgi:hypothetical protein